MREATQQFIQFEKNMLSRPETAFFALEEGLKGRRKIIWNEFINWQQSGGKIKDNFQIKELEDGILFWKIDNVNYGQKIDKLAPFTIEQYKKGLQAVFSFTEDHPQYYKFADLEGMFNPLRLLLYEFL